MPEKETVFWLTETNATDALDKSLEALAKARVDIIVVGGRSTSFIWASPKSVDKAARMLMAM